MPRDTFEHLRVQDHTEQFSAANCWCIVAGRDERDYVVMLQMTPENKRGPMVRAGCRYMTLPEARKHWVSAGRNANHRMRDTARRMLALIDIAVARAKYKGWLDGDVKFNAKPRQVRR